MWIHFNLIGIGFLTIFMPMMIYTRPDAQVIMSMVLFSSGIYLTALYFIMLYYKDSRDKAISDFEKLKKDFESLKQEINDDKKNIIDKISI